MKVLYEEINQKTSECFTDEQLCNLSVKEIFTKWFEVAETKRHELLNEGLTESVKELDEMVRIQKQFTQGC